MVRDGSSNSRWRLAQRTPPARSSNQSRSAALPPRASCWRRHVRSSVPARGMESVKTDACASAIQTHTTVRPDAREPEAGEPAQQGNSLNRAPADPRTPRTRWPPSACGASRMTPPTAKGPHPNHAGGPWDEPKLSLDPEAVHCYPDRTTGGHRQEQPIRGSGAGSPSAPISTLRCGADTPPPQAPWQRSQANGSEPQNVLVERDSPSGLCSAAAHARQPAVAAIDDGRDKHDPTVSPEQRWELRSGPDSHDGLQHQSLRQAR